MHLKKVHDLLYFSFLLILDKNNKQNNHLIGENYFKTTIWNLEIAVLRGVQQMENHFKNLLTLSRNNKSLCHLSHHPLLPTSPPLEGSSTLSQSRLWASLIPWSFILQMLSFWQIGFKRFRAPFPQSLFTQSGNLV